MSSNVATAQAIGTKLCEIFGLESSNVKGIVLDVQVGSVPTLTVHKYIPVSEMNKIVSFLEDYELVRKVGSNGG